jgi:hypothetical protein
MASARRVLERTRRVQVLYAGFAPDTRGDTSMVNPRVLALMRSPRPDREWHSGELETALVLARRPDLARRPLLRRLPPVWLDFRKSLREGARRFEEIDRRSRPQGYFGWPAVARPRTAELAMALRGRLIARELVASLRAWKAERPSRGGSGSRRRAAPLGSGRAIATNRPGIRPGAPSPGPPAVARRA